MRKKNIISNFLIQILTAVLTVGGEIDFWASSEGLFVSEFVGMGGIEGGVKTVWYSCLDYMKPAY